MTSIVPVVLSGGSGTRLWPLSREKYPKQLLPLVDDQSMLQATVARIDGIPGVGDPLLVCNEEHRFVVAEQVRLLNKRGKIILEPFGRNTAPALTLAALFASQGGGRSGVGSHARRSRHPRRRRIPGRSNQGGEFG